MVNEIFKYLAFWGFWLIIPVGYEFLKAIISAIIVFFKYDGYIKEELSYFPVVTILIPVYNSRNTLVACLDSIYNQTYPIDKFEVFLIDNGSTDDCFSLFQQFQSTHSKIKMWWYYSKKGKSNALNKGIFSSSGKYIINIDSDGWLDKDAMKNIVRMFEEDRKISCITGNVLIDSELIEKTKDKKLKLIQKCEFFEYVESFLIGRNVQSTFDNVYTLAGAFSCFKMESLLKTQMYNSDTLGEDTHMTFQIRKFIGGKIKVCSDAFFYVDPIENFDKLYTQRQRWQRSEIEVAKLFDEYYTGNIKDFFQRFTMRIMISDHTLLFSKLIWMFATLYLIIIGYNAFFLIGGHIILYVIYVLDSFLYSIMSGMYLKKQKTTKKYLNKNLLICFLLPLYRVVIFLIRVAGIINSISTEATWKTRTLTDEFKVMQTWFVKK